MQEREATLKNRSRSASGASEAPPPCCKSAANEEEPKPGMKLIHAFTSGSRGRQGWRMGNPFFFGKDHGTSSDSRSGVDFWGLREKNQLVSSLAFLAAVNVVIWVGLFFYLWRIDRRIAEKERE